VDGPDEAAQKIRHYGEVLKRNLRLTFQMDQAARPQAKLLRAMEILGTRMRRRCEGRPPPLYRAQLER
jgi:hypothetical protein